MVGQCINIAEAFKTPEELTERADREKFDDPLFKPSPTPCV